MQQPPMGAPFERILALDFETAWDRKSLGFSCQTTEEYIRDPRFKAWGCSYSWLQKTTWTNPKWVSRDDLPRFFAHIDWRNTATVAHNAQFDITILTWLYGHTPCFIFDTLSMARALYGVEVGNSLAKLAERFGFPPKGKGLQSSEGYMDTLPPEVEVELSAYCNHDVTLCYSIFEQLVDRYPQKELRLIDMTLRMFIEPRLQLDKHMLIDAIKEEKEKREGLLMKLKVDEAALASNDKFAEVLKVMGVEPPMKISKTTGKNAFAFAKNDSAFQALINHDREDIALLCEARLAVKSTLERTRAQRFLDIAQRGPLPVPLNYYSAHTGRYGGSRGSGINMQNLKRGSFLRKAIYAPDGYILVVADLSQIEARVLAWLADYRDMLKAFASGKDPYAEFGAVMFGIPGMTKDSHPALRQSAKSAVLGAGYGLGWANFAGQLLTGFLGAPPMLYGIDMCKQLGMSMEDVDNFLNNPDVQGRLNDIPRTCTNDELIVHCCVAKRIIDLYRNAAAPVVRFWRLCDDYINKCLVDTGIGSGRTISHKCLTFTQGQVVLPSGLSLRYPDIQGKPDENGRVQWTYDGGKSRKKLYGGKLTENIVQAVARIVMTDGMLRVQKRYPAVLTVHDEGVYMVPEVEEEEAKVWIKEQVLKEPKYLKGIPLGCTIESAKRYGDAK